MAKSTPLVVGFDLHMFQEGLRAVPPASLAVLKGVPLLFRRWLDYESGRWPPPSKP